MTREDLKRQVLARVKVPAGFFALGDVILSHWLEAYPAKFVFGPMEMLSAERKLRRELNHAQRVATNRRIEEEATVAASLRSTHPE